MWGAVAQSLIYPASFRGTASPVYASATTFSVAHIAEALSSGLSLVKTTSTVVDYSSVGALNGVARSGDLVGTVTVTSGSAVVTGVGTSFLSLFQAGDPVFVTGAQTRKVQSVNSDTQITCTATFSSNVSGATYRRGGRMVNTWYFLYVITNRTTVGLILSTRNVAGGDTLVDLPTGYTVSKQLPFAIRSDASNNILPFLVVPSPFGPRVLWRDFEESATYQVLAGSVQTSFTAVNLSALVPPIAKVALLECRTTYTSNGQNLILRPTGSGLSTGQVVSGATGSLIGGFVTYPDMVTDSTPSIDHKMTGAGTNGSIYVRGWMPTEVVA